MNFSTHVLKIGLCVKHIQTYLRRRIPFTLQSVGTYIQILDIQGKLPTVHHKIAMDGVHINFPCAPTCDEIEFHISRVWAECFLIPVCQMLQTIQEDECQILFLHSPFLPLHRDQSLTIFVNNVLRKFC